MARAHVRRTCSDVWAQPAIEADVRIAAAEALLEEGRTAEGLAELEKALTFYRSVGATYFLDRGEALLAEAKTA